MQHTMQQRCLTSCVATLILLLAIVRMLKADLNLKAHLAMYKSTQHTRVDGFCCDPLEDTVVCTECDNQFLFCLRPPAVQRDNSSLSRDDENCPLGSFKTGNISGDDAVFESGQDLDVGIPNPMSFDFNLDNWPGSVELYVRVDDVDFANQAYDGNDLVAQFDIPITLGHHGNTSSHTQPKHYYDRLFHGTFLVMAFELSCVESFYGEDCSVFCQPRDDEFGHYKCGENGLIECLDGFQDTTENCTVCALSEGCSSEGGFCNETDRCICRRNYTGEFCEIDLDPCGHKTPCQHNSSCTNNEQALGGYVCSCLDDYSGANCELDLNLCQHKHPCHNNATCINAGPNNYTCKCVPGYEGKDCELETDECSSMPCRNGATCEDHLLHYTCLCTVGFTGNTCEIDINECDPNPCLNGGLCQDMIGTYQCLCDDSFSGKECTLALQSRHVEYAPIIGGVGTTALLMLIILLLMIVLLRLLKQHRKMKVSTIRRQQIAETSHFRIHNPTFVEFEMDSNGAEVNTDESSAIEHRFVNPIYTTTTQPPPPELAEGEYNRLDSRMGSNSNFQRGLVEPSPGYSRINSHAANFVPLHKHHQYEYIDSGESVSPSGSAGSQNHEYDYADPNIKRKADSLATQSDDTYNHYDEAEGVEVSRIRPYHHYEDIDQDEGGEGGVTTKIRGDCYDHLQSRDVETTQHLGIHEYDNTEAIITNLYDDTL